MTWLRTVILSVEMRVKVRFFILPLTSRSLPPSHDNDHQHQHE